MKILRNIILIALITLALLGIYFGSIRSFIKGQKYISALGKKAEITSVEGFKSVFKEVLDYKAPLSDDEVVKFVSGDIVDMASNGKQQEEVLRELVAFIEGYIHEDDVIHLLNTGRTYHFMWIQYGQKEEYFKKAEEYYKKVILIAPKLPPALYGILDLYRARGDAEKAKEYGERILKLWPEDTRVVELLKTIENINL
ncbi:MAG: hypothetical protein Q8P01_00675 [bacterium]|nr:hypothetical protein [bacterium]